MYRKVQQLAFDDFVFPYGELDQENEWVKLANIVPWDVAEREYARNFEDNGAPAHPARVALGACIIKQRLRSLLLAFLRIWNHFCFVNPVESSG